MSKKQLFLDLQTQLKAEVTALKRVRLWNNQIDNEEREESNTYPAVFIEFSEIEHETRLQGQQLANITLTIRTAVVKHGTDDITHLDTVNDVFKALQGFGKDYFTELNRTTERQDADHDNCIVWETDFVTTMTDCEASTDKDLQTVTPPVTLDIISKDLDIDNDSIRSGDGTF